MAHLIESICYNSKNGKPWHELGTAFDGLMTSEQAIQLAQLDWEVEKRPLLQLMPDNTTRVIENQFALVRNTDHNVLGLGTGRYTPVQNREAFGFFDSVVEAGEAMYETAGSLRNGEVIWMLAKLPSYMQVGHGDIIENYVLLSNGHNGKQGVQLALTPVRVVCNNTLSVALKGNKDKINIRHTTNAGRNMHLAFETLGIVKKQVEQVEEMYNAMFKKQMNAESLNGYFQSIVGDSTQALNTIAEFERLLNIGEGSDLKGVRGSLWGAYNAVTEYYDHYKEYQERTDKLEAIWIGSGAKLKEKAFSSAVALL